MLHPADDALSAYLDGELPSGEAQAVQVHLARCPGCAATAGLFSRVEQTLAVGDPGCAAVSTLLSAAVDGELIGEERSTLAAHLRSCTQCDARQAAWGSLSGALAALPAGLPSERVDRAIARLVAPKTRRVRRVAWPTGAAAALAALLIALIASLPVAGPAPQAGVPEQALVAAIQQSVLDPRTNTLYVLRPERGVVSVVDASSNVERATVPVGGRPTALALNILSNTIVVLDAGAKTLTEIDTTSHAIVGATAIAMSGTPTSVQVDGKGKIIVTSTVPPTTTAAPAATPNVPTGQVGVFDPSTKRLETVRPLEIAPRLVVLDATATRALFVSAAVTTVVEADTYRVIGTLPGGVAAAFGARDTVAVLAASDGQAALIVSGAQPHRIALNGEPLAVVSLPDGSFAALTSVGGRGVITLVATDGVVLTTIDVAIPGGSLTYDASSRRFAVSAPGGVSFASLPIAAAGPAPVTPVETPRPTPTPTPAPSVAPTPQPAPVAVPVSSQPPPVPGAQHAFGDTYRLDGLRAAVIAGSGASLWFVDQNNGVNALDTVTGASRQVAQLPLGSTVSSLEVSPGYVFVSDVRAARLNVLRISDGYLATVPVPFLRSATAFAVGRDDRLWFGTREGSLLRWDPRSQRLESVDLRNSQPIVALAADDAGRLWAATRGSSTLLSYDTLASRLGSTALGAAGSVSALAGDGAGTLWAGTDQGELLAIRSGQTAAIGSIGRPVGDLVSDAAGRGWYVAPGGFDLVFSRLDGSVAPLRVPPLLQGLSFDTQARAWQVDPGTGSLYVTRITGR